MEDVEVDNPSTLTLAQLVRIGEAVLKEFHNRHNSRCSSFIALDRCSSFPQVAEGNTDPASDTRQLQGRVDGAADGVHIICYLDEEAGNQFTTTSPTSVEEAWCSGLITLVDNFIGNILGNGFISVGKVESVEENTIFHSFQIIFAVICLQCILVVELIGSHERFKLEILSMDESSQLFNIFRRIEFDKFFFQIVFFDEIVDFFSDRSKLLSVWFNVFFKESL